MLIHSTNITGLGAIQVVISFIDAAANLKQLETAIIYLPGKGQLSNYEPLHGKVFRYKRYLPNSISRFIEVLFSNSIFPAQDFSIVLGDIPLRGIKKQIVLVHQPNLISPSVNSLSSSSFNFKVLRLIFRMNLKYVHKIVVQTDIMKEEMLLSYPKLENRIVVIPQPIPNWFKIDKSSIKKNEKVEPILLFFPAAGYKHKNHEFLLKLNDYFIQNEIEIPKIEIWVTLTKEEFFPYENISFVKNLGRLDHDQVIATYSKCDCLLFLSLAESYGLPLVESLSFSLPILTVDLPYSRWMCEKSAYYFNHKCMESFLCSLKKMTEDLKQGIINDTSDVIRKFPESWENVVLDFLLLRS